MINIPHPHLFGPAVHLSHIIRRREFWKVCCRIGRNNAFKSLSRLLDPKCMLARATIYLYYRFDLFNNVSISLSTINEMNERDSERGDSKYLNTHLIFSDKFSIYYCTSSLFSWVIVYIRGREGGSLMSCSYHIGDIKSRKISLIWCHPRSSFFYVTLILNFHDSD